MTLEVWCRTHLDGGFMVVPCGLSFAELVRVPLRRRGGVLLTVRAPRDGRVRYLTAQRFAARRAHATGVRWRVGPRPIAWPQPGAQQVAGGQAGRGRAVGTGPAEADGAAYPCGHAAPVHGGAGGC